jgi:hypothetical protein
MGEASPSGVAPRSPWRVRSVAPPAPTRAPPRARCAHCPDRPARDGRGARGARTPSHSSSIPAILGALHTLMHTASMHKPDSHAFALRRVQQPTARPSRAPATQTRTPARCAARNRRRRASPPPPACFPPFAATPRLTKFRNPPCGFLSHARGRKLIPVWVPPRPFRGRPPSGVVCCPRAWKAAFGLV